MIAGRAAIVGAVTNDDRENPVSVATVISVERVAGRRSVERKGEAMRSSHVTALAAIAIVALPTAASGTDGTPTPGGGAGSAARARYTSGPAGLTATPVTDPTARKKPVTRTDILNRMVAAINAHDLDAFVSLYAEDVVSEAPIHPGMSFVGRENVRRNWAGIFARVPDIRATV
jgi:SnoaL-like domain